jgi:seryl-tRNA synthetase
VLDPRSLERRRDEIAEACERRGVAVDLDGAIAAQHRVAALQTALGELNRRKNEHQAGGQRKLAPEQREAHAA